MLKHTRTQQQYRCSTIFLPFIRLVSSSMPIKRNGMSLSGLPIKLGMAEFSTSSTVSGAGEFSELSIWSETGEFSVIK